MKKLEDMTEPELGHFMNTLARNIQSTSKGLGVEPPLFCLVVFNDPHVTQYVGNCTRASMVKAMREMARVLEKHEDEPRRPTT